MGLTSKTAALVFGAVFVVVGILGFIPNPLLSPNGIFMVNTTHNLVHLISGAVLLAGVYTQLGPSLALKIIGVVYALVAILGFVMTDDMLLGMIAMNAADRWLHVVLAIALLAAGFGLDRGMKKA